MNLPPLAPRRAFQLISCALLASAVSACGQRGPLTLPPDTKTLPAPSSLPSAAKEGVPPSPSAAPVPVDDTVPPPMPVIPPSPESVPSVR